MFKRLETSWNARTPKILHNRTKENYIFQLSLVGVLIGGMYVKDWYDERRLARLREKHILTNKH